MDARSGSPTRIVALDIRQQVAHVGALDAAQRIAVPPATIALAELEAWLRRTLLPGDAVVFGAQINPWPLYDLIAPLVASVTVVHPQIARLLPGFQQSDDPRETLKLARLHAAGLVPALWAPAQAVRDVRALTAQRRRLILQHAEASTVLGQLLRSYRLTPPGRNRLGADRPDWWARQALGSADQPRARDSLAALNRATALLREIEQLLNDLSRHEIWRAQVDRLLVVPGMDRLSGLVLLGAIGDAARFPGPEQLASYAGLVHGSAPEHAGEGRRELRATMLDVAERAVRYDSEWRTKYAALEQRLGNRRAIVATARKLLAVVWKTLAAPEQARAVGEAVRPAA